MHDFRLRNVRSADFFLRFNKIHSKFDFSGKEGVAKNRITTIICMQWLARYTPHHHHSMYPVIHRLLGIKCRDKKHTKSDDDLQTGFTNRGAFLGRIIASVIDQTIGHATTEAEYCWRRPIIARKWVYYCCGIIYSMI